MFSIKELLGRDYEKREGGRGEEKTEKSGGRSLRVAAYRLVRKEEEETNKG